METVRATASALGLDPDAVAAALEDPASLQEALADFRQARALGVDSFPTVLVHLPDGSMARLGSAISTADDLSTDFARLTSSPE